MRFVLVIAATMAAVGAPRALAQSPSTSGTARFTDDFEHGLSQWILSGVDGISLVDGGGAHGQVMRLRSNGDVHALVRGSERWGNVAIEGDVMFPTAGDSYLGVIYNYRERAARSDFGLIYIKNGNRAYLQANPHRDYNVTRTFYPESVGPLAGPSAIRAGEWQRFRVEVVGGVAHFYVGDMTTPQLTFPIAEAGRGLVGLQPRSVGEDVWVDNVTVRSIDVFTYRGADRPAVDYAALRSTLRWDVVGPLARTEDDIARTSAKHASRWRPFALDNRGALETARVVDYHGANTVAYFRTRVRSDSSGIGFLRTSSVDDLAVWVNGRFESFVGRNDAAWFDAGVNAQHTSSRTPIMLAAGDNVIVIRVRGGVYAAGGFFASVERGGVRLGMP